MMIRRDFPMSEDKTLKGFCLADDFKIFEKSEQQQWWLIRGAASGFHGYTISGLRKQHCANWLIFLQKTTPLIAA